ncbi:MAG: hypothetical protein K2J33_00590 [Alistipes sp.]|nr:hypothetical protein [Alistipes sp.]
MKKTLYFAALLIVAVALFVPTESTAKNKKIIVQPAEAKIYVDGSYVADGNYFLKFKRRDDLFVVKVEAPGYVTKVVKIFKSDTRKTVTVALREDDSLESSVASNLANRYFTVNVREGVDENLAWKLLSQVMLNYFDEMQTSDKASGYMTTTWVTETFPMAEVKVRTRVQIKQATSEGLTYQIRITSEIAPLGSGEQSYKPWPRVLKKYESLINEMQARIGEN